METFLYPLTRLKADYEASIPHADPRVKNWLLLNNSPIYVWYLTIVYLAFVYFGTKYMKNRAAYQLTGVLVVYNLGLVVLSVYMFLEIVLSTYNAGYNYICAPYNEETIKDPKELRVASVLWWYFFSKAIELFDTVLMVLRKKNAQITVLHVYHHASMLLMWWWVMMFTPGGLATMGSCINCFVHIFMYAYYGLSAIPPMRKYLWWKKYLTNLQLIQFVITLCHTLYNLFSGCDFPRWGQYLLGGYMVTMLVLFGNFYIQTYTKGRSRQKTGKGAQTNGQLSGQTNGHFEANGHLTSTKTD